MRLSLLSVSLLVAAFVLLSAAHSPASRRSSRAERLRDARLRNRDILGGLKKVGKKIGDAGKAVGNKIAETGKDVGGKIKDFASDTLKKGLMAIAKKVAGEKLWNALKNEKPFFKFPSKTELANSIGNVVKDLKKTTAWKALEAGSKWAKNGGSKRMTNAVNGWKNSVFTKPGEIFDVVEDLGGVIRGAIGKSSKRDNDAKEDKVMSGGRAIRYAEAVQRVLLGSKDPKDLKLIETKGKNPDPKDKDRPATKLNENGISVPNVHRVGPKPAKCACRCRINRPVPTTVTTVHKRDKLTRADLVVSDATKRGIAQMAEHDHNVAAALEFMEMHTRQMRENMKRLDRPSNFSRRDDDDNGVGFWTIDLDVTLIGGGQIRFGHAIDKGGDKHWFIFCAHYAVGATVGVSGGITGTYDWSSKGSDYNRPSGGYSGGINFGADFKIGLEGGVGSSQPYHLSGGKIQDFKAGSADFGLSVGVSAGPWTFLQGRCWTAG